MFQKQAGPVKLGVLLTALVGLTACGADDRPTIVSEDQTRVEVPQADTRTSQAPGDSDQQRPVTDPQAASHAQKNTIEIVSMPKTVKPGDELRLEVKALPATELKVDTRGAEDEPSAMTTNAQGEAAWSWKVDEDFRGDRIPIAVMTDVEDSARHAIVLTSVPVDRRQEDRTGQAIDARISNEPTARRGEEVVLMVEATPGMEVDADVLGYDDAISDLEDKVVPQNGRISWKFRLDRDHPGNKLPMILTLRKGDQEKILVKEIPIHQADRTAGADPAGGM